MQKYVAAIQDWLFSNLKDAILRPGADQMGYVKALIESRPYEERVPDQSLIAGNYEGSNYMVVTRGSTYAMVYSPNGLSFKVAMGKIEGAEVSASWYDLRTGAAQAAGVYANSGETVFTPPSAGSGNDRILVLYTRQGAAVLFSRALEP